VTDGFRLDGKVAVVTGASSGLGARCARVLHGAGAHVVLVARRKDRLDALAVELPGAVAVAADLADPAGAPDVIARAADGGRLDVLVNAAGITYPSAATRETLEMIRGLVDLNLVTPFVLSQAALAVMRANGGGAIVNISSIVARLSEPTIPSASYAASKGGLESLTRELAVQWARHDVRVNAIAPGWFPTEMTEGLTGDPERLARFSGKIPLGRLGELREIDGPLLLLASDAGSYITGQTIVVDGGISAL
jgi:NAD(P)-dependent dehydrogenase (short-subunit alcohol dehydrogenase family)